MPDLFTGTGVQNDQNVAANKDLPAWYQQYTQNLAGSGMSLAQNLNKQPLPGQSTAGFNQDQSAAFNSVRGNQGLWQPQMNAAMALNNQIPGTASKFIDYAQGAVAGPAMSTAGALQPWAQGAQDALAGNASESLPIIMERLYAPAMRAACPMHDLNAFAHTGGRSVHAV